jgi:hypothetical protein
LNNIVRWAITNGAHPVLISVPIPKKGRVMTALLPLGKLQRSMKAGLISQLYHFSWAKWIFEGLYETRCREELQRGKSAMKCSLLGTRANINNQR